MKATPFKEISDVEMKFIIDACALYREKLDKQERDMFDLAFSKVVYAKRDAELDSMEMILLSKALKLLSVEIFRTYGKEEKAYVRQSLINLAHVIDLQRIHHQQKHHPLKKKILTA